MAEPEKTNQPKTTKRPMAIGLATLGSLAGALVRLVPHSWNLSPSYAAELYAGARLRAWQAFGLALGMRFVTDIIIYWTPFRGQEDSAAYYVTIMPWVYLSIALNVLLGRLVKNTEAPWKIGGVTLLASVQFFLVSNFGSWIGTPTYPKNLAGLIECYVAGLAWFSPSLISYIVFVPVLFGAHALLTRLAFPSERVVATAS
jgi:hypothetical protein